MEAKNKKKLTKKEIEKLRRDKLKKVNNRDIVLK